MTIDFGTGPTLREASPYLRDDIECVERILDVVERNSVIEALPPFSPEFREQLRQELLIRFAESRTDETKRA
jgi:hypothetical protein